MTRDPQLGPQVAFCNDVHRDMHAPQDNDCHRDNDAHSIMIMDLVVI